MPITNRRPRRSKEQIAALLREFQASGMTRAAFGRQHGLHQNFPSLLLKKARLQPVNTVPVGPAFFEVEQPTHSDSSDYRINFGGRLALGVRNGFSPAELTSLLQLLERTLSSGRHHGAL
jgi:hypothetical protein